MTALTPTSANIPGGYIYLQWSSATRQAYYQVDTMGDDCYAWLDDVIVIEGGYIRTECWISSGLTNVY